MASVALSSPRSVSNGATWAGWTLRGCSLVAEVAQLAGHANLHASVVGANTSLIVPMSLAGQTLSVTGHERSFLWEKKTSQNQEV